MTTLLMRGSYGIGAVVLDIPCLVAELFEPGEVVDRLPGDAGERHLADEMEKDDLAAFAHEEPTEFDGNRRGTDNVRHR